MLLTSQSRDSAYFSVPIFMLQLLGVPFAIMITGFLACLVLDLLFNLGDNTLVALGVYTSCGFVLGYSLQSLFAKPRSSGGQWIWIAPVSFLFFVIAKEPRRGHTLLHVAATFFSFTSASPYAFEVLLVTLPALGSCFYALGVLCASARSASQAESGST
jgi:hypothetical protein